MEISDEARKMLENKVANILRMIDIPESQKKDIKNELISNYTEASITRAEGHGASIVEKSDVESVFENSESPEEIASMYMASYVSSLKKAGIVSRTIAYIIDSILVDICTFILSLPFILAGALLINPNEIIMLPLILRFYYVLIIVQLAITFIYFAISEGFYGYTPGKWLLGLKVLKADGGRVSYSEAMLRSIPKLFILAILADALLMVTLYGKDKQRLFDKIAGTIVIHRNKP